VQDDSVGDLAKKFNVALEAIALQTRHIVDEMNSRGHAIREIYMSGRYEIIEKFYHTHSITGGQAKNIPLMQLIADVCSLPVVLPNSHSTAVVLGSAVLARCASEQSANSTISVEQLWEIMVKPDMQFSRKNYAHNNLG
jgi:ribulose kinase